MSPTYSRAVCPACGSVKVKRGKRTCKCLRCDHMGPTRLFGREHESRNTGIQRDSSSVPRRNKRRPKWGQDGE